MAFKDPKTTTSEELGLLMAGHSDEITSKEPAAEEVF
jgi:hypothetical protein